MNSPQKLLLKFSSAVITFCLVYAILSIFIYSDFLASLIPGWHTTIYPLSSVLRVAIFIGVSAILTSLLFSLILRFLTYLWLKIFP
jgi:hypothetical protein